MKTFILSLFLVTTTVFAAAKIQDADIKTGAAITRSKMANGTAYRVLANNSSGVMSENAALTASRALASDANGQPVAATTTATELGYVNGVTSAIQTQLNAKETLFAGTQGSVFFASSAGAISEDNSNIFWDDTNNRLGLGIASPTYRLHLKAPSGVDQIMRLEGDGANSHRLYDFAVDSSGFFSMYQSGAGYYALSVSNGGDNVGVGQYGGCSNTSFCVYSAAEDDIPMVAKGYTAGSQNLQEWRLANDSVVASISSDGTANLAQVIDSGLTADRVPYSRSTDKRLTSSAVTSTELGYLGGVTSAVQTQLAAKATITPTNHGVVLSGAGNAMTALAAGNGTILQANTGADPTFTATPALGITGTTLGRISFAGDSSGAVTISPQSAAGTYNFNLPITAGTAGQPLLSGGGSAAAQTYGTLGVAGGGTGLATLTAHSLQVGNGTTALTQIAVPASGTVLTGVASSDPAFTATPTLGVTGATKGTLAFAGNTSGAVTIQPAAAAGTYTLTLPTDDGNSNDVLTSNGSGVLSWAAPASGTPTFVGARIYSNTTTTLTADTETDMVYTTESYDVGSHMSSSQYTCGTTGYYKVDASVRITGTPASGSRYEIWLYVNGSAYSGAFWQSQSTTAVNQTVQVHDLVPCTSGQVVKIRVKAQGTSGTAIQAEDTANFFAIMLVGV